MLIFPSRSRVKSIMTLAFPIMGGMISQNIFNLVDTAMVGQLGTVALAAVGIGGLVNFFCHIIVFQGGSILLSSARNTK